MEEEEEVIFPLTEGEIIDAADRRVPGFALWVDRENERRKAAMQALRDGPVQMLGVTLVPGHWYAVGVQQYGRVITRRRCQYIAHQRERSYGFPERDVYVFDAWPVSPADWRYIRPQPQRLTEKSIVSLEEVKEPEDLREHVARVNRVPGWKP